jgi:hypothetical protein
MVNKEQVSGVNSLVQLVSGVYISHCTLSVINYVLHGLLSKYLSIEFGKSNEVSKVIHHIAAA